ncbi:MAG: hypothetical protein RJB39_504 [Candidatus Parcubacteria bacterium]|jgi:DNA polymerase-3 subunit gamma/tau
MTTQSTHNSLYRKYRPESFEQVAGQDHIVKVLQAAVENKTPHHAYLFTGTRGIGKTSIARIFSKALGVETEDLYEIDAASYTGVDNIRELTESAMTLPFRSPYKVYILDEVHMLSKAAFNAFLKGLEEPPAHVVYILATTELGKLPDTIVSRCEIHTFRTPTVDTLSKIAQSVSKKEGYEVDPDGIRLIAMSGDGSFRDTLGVLQKVMNAAEGKEIGLKEVEAIVGVPKLELIGQLAESVLNDSSDALKILDTIRNTNTDGKIVYDLYVETLREKLRDTSLDEAGKTKVIAALTRSLEEYRHLRFVDPLTLLEVVIQ